QDGKTIYAFRPYRAPESERRSYMPLVVPPVYNKDFRNPLFTDLWRKCVAALSTAESVVFVGYALAEVDFHARFIFRCGFYNQLEGELKESGDRAKPTGASKVTIVNPDVGSAKRIEGTLNVKNKVDWQPMFASDWLDKGSM